MSTPYLIAHKCCGEAVFDVAVKLDDETWVLQSGGWRVYPFFYMPLREILPEMQGQVILSGVPADAEDCFPIGTAPKTPVRDTAGLLAELGLIQREPVRRI